MKIKNKLVSILCASTMLFAFSVITYAQAGTVDNTRLASESSVASPRYTNIWYTTAAASTSDVFASMETYDSMSLSIKAVAYRNGTQVASFSASAKNSSSLFLEESASLRSGDVVKFTYKAGSETASDSVTV